MSILEETSPDELANRLESMKPAEIRRLGDEVQSLLQHRAVLVRRAAAEALGRAQVGATALRKRLRGERNVVVSAEIMESLARLRDRESLPQLYRLAEKHPASLVRSYAFLAVADILGKKAIPYLAEKRRRERNRYVRAALDTALFAKGTDKALPDLLKDLNSRDFRVRALVANLLYFYAPARHRTVLVEALREALERETVAGVHGDIERAIGELS
jgi:HEAT repeat protein